MPSRQERARSQLIKVEGSPLRADMEDGMRQT